MARWEPAPPRPEERTFPGAFGKWFARHDADADEARDAVESDGFAAVRETAVAKSTGCIDCILKSDACDTCICNVLRTMQPGLDLETPFGLHLAGRTHRL